MPTLLITASTVNPHFSSSDGLEWQFRREARVGIMQPREGGKPAGLASSFRSSTVVTGKYHLLDTLRIRRLSRDLQSGDRGSFSYICSRTHQ